MANFVQPLPESSNLLSDLHEAASWRYEMRREIQEIVPRLWLGPYVCARDRDLLVAHGITHILCIRGPDETMLQMRFPDQFRYQLIEVSDSPLQHLIPFFPMASAFIHNALQEGGTVLVHCNGGISRSPAFVVAYLMEAHNLDFPTAFETVQNKRFCMNPIESFKFQLKEYEPLISARREALSIMREQSAAPSRGIRRRLEEAADDEFVGVVLARALVGDLAKINRVCDHQLFRECNKQAGQIMFRQ